MNAVLYADQHNVGLLTPSGVDSAPHEEVKRLLANHKVRGSITLVMSGELRAVSPPALTGEELNSYLDAQCGGITSHTPEQPTLITVHDAETIHKLSMLLKGSPAKITTLTPLVSAALLVTLPTQAAVIVHVNPNTYETATLTPSKTTFNVSNRNERTNLQRVLDIAVKQLSAIGQNAKLIVITPQGDLEEVTHDVEHLTLAEAISGALLPNPETFEAPLQEVAQQRRTLLKPRKLDKPLIAALGVAALLNVGLLLSAQSVQASNRSLQQQVDQLSAQANEFQALQSKNAALETQVKQAQLITQTKGPLAEDLPLLTNRIREIGGTISALSGPNPPTETDGRAFGGTVQRTYDLTAYSPSAEQLAQAYQERGLRADIRNVECTLSCKVSFRAAPTKVIATLQDLAPKTTPNPATGAEGTGAGNTSPVPNPLPKGQP